MSLRRSSLALMLLTACSAETVVSPTPKAFTLQEIPRDSLWWRWPCCASWSGFPIDSNGIPTLIVQGQVTYHPTYIAENALAYADSYEKSGLPIYHDGLLRWVDALLAMGDTLDGGAVFVPFSFPFALHGDVSETLNPPWYSGFTQGMLLSLLVRTASITHDAKYIDAAHRVYRSLAQSNRVTHVDANGYFWIDEYPLAQPDLTLNGFAYAVRGLYEYWQWQRTPAAEQTLLNALSALKHYAPQFRDPGKPSVYCLRHRIPVPAYHGQHIQLLEDLYRMTGDPFFSELAGEFAADFTP